MGLPELEGEPHDDRTDPVVKELSANVRPRASDATPPRRNALEEFGLGIVLVIGGVGRGILQLRSR